MVIGACMVYSAGPLRSVEGFFMMIYRKSAKDKRPAPALQIIVGCGNVNPATDSYETSEYDEKDRNVVLIYNYRPKSVGHIRLGSKNYRDNPIIDPNFYSDPEDIKVVLDGMALQVTALYSIVYMQSNLSCFGLRI